jgi:hypothetical protein
MPMTPFQKNEKKKHWWEVAKVSLIIFAIESLVVG